LKREATFCSSGLRRGSCLLQCEKAMKLKILAVALSLVLILNLILAGLKIISLRLFWALIAVIALIAYKIMPKLRKQ